MAYALFHIDLNLGKEYKDWMNKLIETIVVFLIVHALQVIQDPNRLFLNEDFLQALIFTLVGFSFYYLVWKKLVTFVYEDDVEGFNGTIRLFGAEDNDEQL